MELILINNSKLKIMLTADEVRKYDIERGSEGGADMRRTFAPVLDRAKECCGFDASAGRVFIQLFPSREGGCEMFVTKLPPGSAYEKLSPADKRSDTTASDVAEKTPYDGDYALSDYADTFWGFDTLNGLISACRVLRAKDLGGGSRAYISDSGGCVLRLPCADDSPMTAFLSEFARHESPSAMRTYIPEHCRRLVTDTDCADDAGFLGRF